MLYPPMSDLLENINSRYLLVNVIARRARQVSIEAEKLGEPLTDKPVSIAIGEIAEGKLTASVKTETEQDYDVELTDDEQEIE
ncbi:MAG: DNA-directed RNA polymerase subunit omega [Ruminococcaceae bacterium]|nr:DNA-directed RNA polymerase subunit omega [Oscillospiraceae bacterium]